MASNPPNLQNAQVRKLQDALIPDEAQVNQSQSALNEKLKEEAIKACMEGDVPKLGMLLSEGEFAHKRSLVSAVQENPRALEVLLNAGLSVNYDMASTGSMIGSAAFFNRIDNARLLLERGADPNNLGPVDGQTTALAGASGGWHANISMVELLLKYGAQIQGSGALKAAVAKGKLDIVELLIKNGADVNETAVRLRESSRATPLQLAKAKGHHDIARILIKAGAVDKD